MSRQRPKPRPIRLTKSRAEALLAAAEIGVAEWEQSIIHGLNSRDLTEQRAGKALDGLRGEALAAMTVVAARYVGRVDEPVQPHLFE